MFIKCRVHVDVAPWCVADYVAGCVVVSCSADVVYTSIQPHSMRQSVLLGMLQCVAVGCMLIECCMRVDVQGGVDL